MKIGRERKSFFLKHLKFEPDNPEVMVQIGYHVHAKKGEWDQMNEIFDRAIATDPDKKNTRSACQ